MVLLTCLQREHVDSGEGAARLQPGDPSLPSILGPSWPKIIGPNLLRQQFWPGQGAAVGMVQVGTAKGPAEEEREGDRDPLLPVLIDVV